MRRSDPKPFWASRTLWANALAIAGVIGARFGLELTEALQAEVLVVIMGAVNIALRFVTDTPVTVRRKP